MKKIRTFQELQDRKTELVVENQHSKERFKNKLSELPDSVPVLNWFTSTGSSYSDRDNIFSKLSGVPMEDILKSGKTFLAAIPFSTFILPRIIGFLPIKKRYRFVLKLLPYLFNLLIPYAFSDKDENEKEQEGVKYSSADSAV
mgnify:CR=1 FL=1